MCSEVKISTYKPDRKELIKIISTRYFLVIKEINKYLVDMILINSFRSGTQKQGGEYTPTCR
jgi:hypothetical protein